MQLLVHVPVTTTLGLGNEPGWLEGYGWISAPQVRQLLPVAELRQVCTTATGQVVDLADRVTRPPPTPGGVRAALVAMATRPFDITDKAWRVEPRHDPSPALDRFVAVRDRFCDGPTQPRVRAEACDDDHKQPYPDGPTAAWNLAARARRTHGLKHFGWTDIATPTGTLWISPAGQLVQSTATRRRNARSHPTRSCPTPTGCTSSRPSSCANSGSTSYHPSSLHARRPRTTHRPSDSLSRNNATGNDAIGASRPEQSAGTAPLAV